MSAKTQNLAKSLHTVSVLVAIARALPVVATLDIVTDPRLYAVCRVDAALRVLGYELATDPFELRAKAIAALSR